MSIAVKERPILFSGPMVRAILAGNKTQTRRVMTIQYDGDKLLGPEWYAPAVEKDGMIDAGPELYGVYDADGEFGCKCPYGAPGDRLWVRETWTPDHEPFYPHFPICYRADFGPEYEREDGKVFSSEQNAWFPFKWRPSIFMPRRASRITLEITGVRVERLHEIDELDAAREGIAFDSSRMGNWEGHASATAAYAKLWESINGPGSWDANPWVWVIEFKQVKP